MNRKVLCLIVVLTVVTLSLAACGGGSTPAPAAPVSSGAAPASANAAQPTAIPAAPQAMTPKDLGDKIGVVYVGSLEAVTKLLENKPDAATALPQGQRLARADDSTTGGVGPTARGAQRRRSCPRR